MGEQYLETLVEKNIKESLDKIKKTLPFLSKFEKTKVLGLRIQELSSGASSFLNEEEQVGLLSYVQVAEKELKLGKLKLVIARKMANEVVEFWRVNDLIDLNL